MLPYSEVLCIVGAALSKRALWNRRANRLERKDLCFCSKSTFFAMGNRRVKKEASISCASILERALTCSNAKDSSWEMTVQANKGKFSAHGLFIAERLNPICYCHLRYGR